jgi:hypothetical protein
VARTKKEKETTKYIEGVSVGKIKRMRNLSGTWNFFGFDTKKDFDAAGITDLQMVQYINGTGEANKATREAWAMEQAEAVDWYEKNEAEWKEGVESRVEEFEREVARKVAQYLDDFEAPTESDEDNLRNLAAAQLRLEAIHRDRLRQMALPFAVRVNKTSRDILASLADEEKALLQQIRLLQKAMGIDRPTREDKASEVTGVDRVKAIIEKAKEFLANEIADMNHCGIRTAWVADHFPETYFKVVKQCARCGGLIVEEHGNVEWRSDIECPLGCGGVLVKEENRIKCQNCGWECCVGKDIGWVDFKKPEDADLKV